MNWFFFALAGTAIFGLVALTDKYMLSSHFPDALVYAWVTGLAGGGSASLGIVVLGGAGIVQVGYPFHCRVPVKIVMCRRVVCTIRGRTRS